MRHGWKKNLDEIKQASSFETKVNLCDVCYVTKFPLAVIYDGVEGNCPHLFALKAKEEL